VFTTGDITTLLLYNIQAVPLNMNYLEFDQSEIETLDRDLEKASAYAPKLHHNSPIMSNKGNIEPEGMLVVANPESVVAELVVAAPELVSDSHIGALFH
jgi:hypothetical protein